MSQQSGEGLLRYWMEEAENYAEQIEVLRGSLSKVDSK
jgi:hypothetical protein